MKTLQIQVSDQEHQDIKVEAAKQGVSIKAYVLACINHPLLTIPPIKLDPSKVVTSFTKGEPDTRSIEERWSGPNSISIKESPKKDYAALQKKKAK